jgi:hypothetical protein
VFAKACRTALGRYPTEAVLAEASRDQYVSQRSITRQTIQHWNMLRYAAEFERDPTLAAACQARLHDIMTELARDNLRGGIACEPDRGNATSCTTPQNFMYTSLIHDFLDAYSRHHAGTPAADTAGRAVTTMARQYYEAMMPKGAGGAIDVAGVWGKLLTCTFAAGGALVSCTGIQGSEPSWDYERPSHISITLVGDPGRCAIAAAALGQTLAGGAFESIFFSPAVGWWKGASQAMHNVVHGVGVAETCAPD